MPRDKTVEEVRDALEQRMRELAYQLGQIDPDDTSFENLVQEMFRLCERVKQLDADR